MRRGALQCAPRGTFVAFVLAAILMVCCLPNTVYAHGAHVEYTLDVAIEITAKYDSGKPMAGAQVVIYAPDDPSTPWLTGICDDQGRFSFVPDSSKPGIWDVQARQAGHGDIVHIPVGDNTTVDASSGFTVLQIVLMTICVLWGLAGTALYFRRGRN